MTAGIVIGRDPFDIADLHRAMDAELAPGLDPGQPIAKAAAFHGLKKLLLATNMTIALDEAAMGLPRTESTIPAI